MEASLAAEQRKQRDPAVTLQEATALIPPELQRDIANDNEALKVEQAQREVRLAEEKLRHHAEAIFQHYAVLVHKWEPLKRTGDASGNPHDPQGQKYLHDSALLTFELFLYRLHSENDVFTRFTQQSLEAQREERRWNAEDEGKILHFLAGRLRSQNCYAGMLREKPGPPGVQCELLPLELGKLEQQYNVVLTQAHLVDSAI